MAVNLNRNGPSLMDAYKEVVDGRLDTNWALFTYEGNTNDIRLAEKGEGGLEEMVEELNSGKVMYAFCRVQDPNSGLPKYVLINWTGEGVKDSRKGMCANHMNSMASFLKGAHVTINARGDDDVEPKAILEKVAKASGANFHFHQPKEYRDAPRGAVGSVYRKVNAVEEIQQTRKDDFWGQTQRDEAVRLQEEDKRVQQERQTLERDRREVEEKQTKDRERSAKERALQIQQEKVQQQIKEEEREAEQQRHNPQENGKRKSGINFAASVQKANEAKSLISQRSFNPRDVFKQREQSFESPAASRPGASRPGNPRLGEPRTGKVLSQKSFERETLLHPQSPPAPAVVPLSPVSPVSCVTRVSPVLSHSPAAPPETTGSPVQAADTANTEEEEWSDEFEDDGDEAPPEDLYEAAPPAGTDEDLYEDVYHQHVSSSGDGDAETSGQGISAKALYDYQAVDDTELTVDPGDIITGIDMLDEGWWRGYGPQGNYGMFPANYVELL
ncbi:drebrin-like protein A isoform X2 [Cyclopterus lumpus]|uniref:drebrin-like protein A isoform X2 n=1 Tax=Cyclopterus lumpus TaxID=8103 RepID=UPI0014864509|nr:drebrin-like protein A isoform X2 [Cyclopterus lumpus]